MLALALPFLALAPALPQSGPETLLPSIPRKRQSFGAQVVAFDGRLIVSAPTQRANTIFERGMVYSYAPDPVTGLQEVDQLIEPSMDLPNMFFGSAMVAEGTTLVVSAPEPDAETGGKVFVFALDPASGTWSETQILDVPNSVRFGTRLLLEQGRLFVVERREQVDDLSRIHEYSQDPTTGLFAAIRQTDLPEDLVQGSSGVVDSLVWIAPDTLIIGDGDFDPGPGLGLSGALLSLRLDPITSTYQPAFVTFSPQQDVFATFGSTMAWDGSHLVVGEPWFSANSTTVGRAHIYTYAAATGPVFAQTLEPAQPGAMPNNQFGRVLAAADGRALISETTCCFPYEDGIPTIHLYEINAATGLYVETGSGTTVTTSPVQSNPSFIPSRPSDSGAIDGDRLVWGFSSGEVGFTKPHGRVFVFAGDDGTIDSAGVASAYCSPGVLNSTGQPGLLRATGNLSNFTNDFTIEANQLPAGQLALLLFSRDATVAFPASSQGSLCLGGEIGRFLALLQTTDASGTATFPLDLDDVPPIIGMGSTLPGRELHFQTWYRDANPAATSNFTDALRVVFEF